MLAIEKYERLAVNFGNAFERTPEDRLLFIADGLVGGQRFYRMRFSSTLQRLGRADGFAAFAAEEVIDTVARDAAEPRA